MICQYGQIPPTIITQKSKAAAGRRTGWLARAAFQGRSNRVAECRACDQAGNEKSGQLKFAFAWDLLGVVPTQGHGRSRKEIPLHETILDLYHKFNQASQHAQIVEYR